MCEERIYCPALVNGQKCGDRDTGRNSLVPSNEVPNGYICPNPRCKRKFTREGDELITIESGREKIYPITDC